MPMQWVHITTNVVRSNHAHGGGVLDATLCDKVCRWLMVGRWFSPGTPVSSTNKPDRHNKTEISLICGKTITIALVTFKKRLKVMHACIWYLATTSGKNIIPSRYVFHSRLLCTQYTITEYYKTATEQPVFSGWQIHHITKCNYIPDSSSRGFHEKRNQYSLVIYFHFQLHAWCPFTK